LVFKTSWCIFVLLKEKVIIMSQFASTNHANQTAREAFEDYRSDESRIKEIENKIKNGEMITTEDILWVCRVAKHGISAQQASWYDHG
jgi:hypothetical protein